MMYPDFVSSTYCIYMARMDGRDLRRNTEVWIWLAFTPVIAECTQSADLILMLPFRSKKVRSLPLIPVLNATMVPHYLPLVCFLKEYHCSRCVFRALLGSSTRHVRLG